MTRIFSIFSLVLLLAACTPPNRDGSATAEEVERVSAEPTTESLMEEVMALHDAVMPEMGNIRSTEKSLRELAESTADQAMRDSYLQQAEMLDSAFKSMMGWMRQFDPEYAGTDEEVVQYLQGQKTQMSGVKELMETALSDGQEMVKSAK